MDGLSPAFLGALLQVGRAVRDLQDQQGHRAVLVGGAAVEFYTGGAYNTSDFDLHTGDHAAAVRALERQGFQRETEPGRLLNTWHHPDHPGYSVQMVSGALFDGHCDADRLRVVYLDPEARIILPPVEDLIADRLGQYCSVPANPDPSTLEQANLLLDLAPNIDWAYLERRVQEDQGDISLLTAARSERRLK